MSTAVMESANGHSSQGAIYRDTSTLNRVTPFSGQGLKTTDATNLAFSIDPTKNNTNYFNKHFNFGDHDYTTYTPFTNSSLDVVGYNTTLEPNSWPVWITDIRIPFYIVILILSVVGNSLVIVTLAQNKRMRTVTNVFLLNLSISDLLLALFCMPFTLIPSVLRNFIFGETVCILIRYLQGVSVSVSCFTLVAISLERYFAICRPLHSRTWQTVTHAYISIAICWGMSAVVSIPIAVYTTLRPLRRIHKCTEQWPSQLGEQVYAAALDLILFLIPVLIMSIAYGMVCYTLWKGINMDAKVENDLKIRKVETDETGIIMSCGRLGHSSKTPPRLYPKTKFDYCGGIRQSNGEKSRAAKMRVIRMLFVIVLEFFICWGPLFFVQTWVAFDRAAVNRTLSSTSNSFIQLLAYVSSCCNPITYCFMNRKFRQGFLSAFHCCRTFHPGRIRRSGTSMSGYNASTRTATSRVLVYDKIQLAGGPDC